MAANAAGGMGSSVAALCRCAGVSRQAAYKARRRRARAEADEELIEHLVRLERAVLPESGTRKLLVMLRAEGVEIGRDRLFALLRRKGLLVGRRKASAPATTDSRHRFAVYANLLKGMELSGPGQAWVCDITYLRTREGFCYLALVTDAYSRKIVGFHAGENLEVEGCLAALRMAIGQLESGEHPVHHSDRGSQYACRAYVEALGARGLGISMTEENHCYENAKAERLNGILKQELGLGREFATRAEAAKAAKQAVGLYNSRRLHAALGYRTPSCVHGEGAKKIAA